MFVTVYGTTLGFGLLGLATAPLLVTAIRSWVPVDPVHMGVIAALSSLVSAGIGWNFVADPVRLAWWWLAVTGLGLAVIDLKCQRLPRPWVGALAGGGLAVFVIVAATTHNLEILIRVFAAPVMVAIFGSVWARLIPGNVGGGDLTLYTALAPYWGWLGWHTVLVGVVAGVLLLGVVAAISWFSGRCGWKSRIAAGPSLIAGGWVGIFLGC